MKEKTNEEKGRQIIIQGIPENIKAEFRAVCALERKTMREKIIELMTKAIDSLKK